MFHKIINIVFGLGMIKLFTFNYMNYNAGPPPRKEIPISSVPNNIISGLGLVKQSNGLYAIPGSNLFYSGENIYQPNGGGYKIGNTNYGLYEGDVQGFVKNGDDSGYDPSMAYLMALNAQKARTNYQPVQNLNIYQPASNGPLLNGSPVLSQPTMAGTGSGAGRFLSGGLLGTPINYSAPQTVAK